MCQELKFLHFSDFHLGRDPDGEAVVLGRIFADLQKWQQEFQFAPDFVFITGDLAQAGKPEQYQRFQSEFIAPLLELLGDGIQERIFVIPGNHDLDHGDQLALSRAGLLERHPNLMTASDEGTRQRRSLADHFANFTAANCPDTAWLNSSRGIFTKVVEHADHRIGIMGINTAWLCENPLGKERLSDKGQLTPGKPLVEGGLNALQDCDLRIVLGHHPPAWWNAKQAQAIFALPPMRKGTVYLHGHLHKSKVKPAPEKGTLILQSAAAFQCREDEKWKNGFCYGRINFQEGYLYSAPRIWRIDSQRFVPDETAYDAEFRQQEGPEWKFRIEGFSPRPAPSVASPVPARPAVAASSPLQHFADESPWQRLVPAELEQYRQPLNEADAVAFFDGRVPTLRVALSSSVRRRKLAKYITTQLILPQDEIRLFTILGPSAEGKSTAIMQIAGDLALSSPETAVYYCSGGTLSEKDLERMIDSNHPHRMVLCADNARSLLPRFANCLQYLKRRGLRNVSFVLASREIDWQQGGGARELWSRWAHYDSHTLSGITSDAREIVESWAAYGEKGLGAMQMASVTDGARQLVERASKESYQREGAFFGAMLRLRFGNRLDSHLSELFLDLQRESPFLLDAFRLIAAMHAEGQYFLSKSILAQALGLPNAELRQRVLGPLGQEAVAVATDEHVYTRHRAIAEATVRVLAESPFHTAIYENSDATYRNLMRAAVYVSQQSQQQTDLGDWLMLGRHFFWDRKPTLKALGMGLQEYAAHLAPNDPAVIKAYASMLDNSGLTERAVEVFRGRKLYSTSTHRYRLRGYFALWGNFECKLGNLALGLWLAIIDLSDQVAQFCEAAHVPLEDEAIWYPATVLVDNWMLQDNTDLQEGAVALAKFCKGVKKPEKFSELACRNLFMLQQSSKESTFQSAHNALAKAIQSSRMPVSLESPGIQQLPAIADLSFRELYSKFQQTWAGGNKHGMPAASASPLGSPGKRLRKS
jgi:hypothetical protein